LRVGSCADTALAYVDLNPARAGLVGAPLQYPWSSAAAHATGHDAAGLLDECAAVRPQKATTPRPDAANGRIEASSVPISLSRGPVLHLRCSLTLTFYWKVHMIP
jgi:hypothetical protein